MEIPDALFKKAKARAASADLSLKDFVCGALREKMSKKRVCSAGGWRVVFGRARATDIARAEEAIEAAFERVDRQEWK